MTSGLPPALPTLVGVALGPGAPDLVPDTASTHLAAADVVFVPGDDGGLAERAALFYAEAWRVERLGRDAALEVAVWLAARPSSTAVVATVTGSGLFDRLADGVRGLLGEVALLPLDAAAVGER